MNRRWVYPYELDLLRSNGVEFEILKHDKGGRLLFIEILYEEDWHTANDLLNHLDCG